MKLIKDGRSENKPVQVICGRCKSVLEVVPADVKRKHYDQRDGNCYEFVCMICTSSIHVDMKHTKWNGI